MSRVQFHKKQGAAPSPVCLDLAGEQRGGHARVARLVVAGGSHFLSTIHYPLSTQPFVCALVILLTLALTVPAAGQTGKITGTVTDAATGDPLPGVNVLIEGTTQGTSTGLDGDYVIIGVRPGSHTIVASFIGFATERREGVRASIDLTTTVDFQLREEVFEGEEVVVVADAITVRKDLTSSEARITSESIENLPVQEVGDILTAQAGVTTSGSGIHIRGGRSSEVAYFVDGVRISDAYDGSVAVQVENDGIEELQIISGTFNAEYGNAMSGVINIVTKEGSPTFQGSVEAYSGSYVIGDQTGGTDFLRGVNVSEFTEDGIQYLGANPYGFLDFDPTHYYNLQGSLSGPIIGDRLTFYGFGRYFRNDGWLYGSRLFTADGTPGDSALVAMNPFEKISGQLNLKYRLNNSMFFNLIALGSSSESRDFDHAWRWAPDGRPTNHDQGYNVNLKFTHTLSAKAFYTLNVANYYSDFERYLYEDPLDPRYNGFLVNPPDTIVTGGQRFLRGGTDLGHFNRNSNTYLVKGDLTSQLATHHLVKGGFEARLDHLTLEGFGILDTSGPDQPFQPVIPDPATTQFSQFDETPFTFSAYVQDKIEYENFIVNAGLRFDYFDSGGQIPADPEDPNVFSPFKDINRFRDLNGSGIIEEDERRPDNLYTLEERQAFWYSDATAKYQLSPRLGVAYPISAEGVIHFSYGHFLQIPTFNRLFDNSEYKLTTESAIYGPFGNPDLKAEKTVMYEIGFRQGIGDIVMDVTGFYRDVRNWVSTSAPIATRLPGVAYVVFANRDYSNVRGVTLKVSKRFSSHYAFDVNYTFQIAEGSNSSPDEEFFALQNNNQPTIALLPLDWDQRHTASASVIVGGSGWGASTLTRYGVGYPYTPFFGQAETRGQNVSSNFPKNSRLKPASFTVDFYGYKDLPVGRFTPRLFVQVYNVFDARNANNVFADTGEPDVTLEQLRTGAFDPGWFVRPDFYTEPRRIQAGMEIRF